METVFPWEVGVVHTKDQSVQLGWGIIEEKRKGGVVDEADWR